MRTPHPYQREAIHGTTQWPGVLRALEQYRSTLLVMPTGTGKSYTFSLVGELLRNRGRVLVVTDRKNLTRQARDNFREHTGLKVGIEMGDDRCDTLFPPDVVCATVQSMATERRLAAYPPGSFGLIIVDEADLSIADSYRTIFDQYPEAKILGVTATPDRTDGKAMRLVYESVAYVYEIRDAIEQGYLSKIRQRAVEVEGLDFSRVKRTTGGDLNEAELEAVLLEEGPLHGVANGMLRYGEGRRGILFAVTVAHAQALADMLNRYEPGVAEAVSGRDDDEEQDRIVKAFKSGRRRILVNCALLTRGVDLPFVDLVGVARQTTSRALYAQMVGRGTRLSPATGKRDLLVLDFQGNAGRHSLVNVADILDGNTDTEIRAKALELVAVDPQLDMLTAIDQAAHDLAAEQRRKALEEAKRRQGIKARATLTSREVDPFVTVTSIFGVKPRAGRWGGAPATERQREALVRIGIDARDVAALDRGQCSELLDAAKRRREQNLCTFKQARILMRFGFNPDVSFDEARRLMDQLAANNWRRTASAAV